MYGEDLLQKKIRLDATNIATYNNLTVERMIHDVLLSKEHTARMS